MKLIIRPALVLFVLLSLITGVIYPLLVTTAGKLFFARQTAGSLLVQNNKILGSDLIAQNFSSPRYFWGRPLGTVKLENKEAIPVDLVTHSASGLDPDISPAGAFYQVKRIARVRKIPVEKILKLVENHIEGRQFGIFGEPRVNVLKLNLALDAMDHHPHDRATSPKSR